MRLRDILFGVLMLVPCVQAGAQGGPDDFARVVANFPIEQAAGKRVKFSGYIKTDSITKLRVRVSTGETAEVNGYAGLWWRADRGEQVAAFDNMAGRGPGGTSDWRRYEVSLSIPSDITNINFGLLQVGPGTAWFADLKIEIDKKPFVSEEFDLNLSASPPQGFTTRGANYEFVADPTQTFQGKPSLRIRRIR